MLEVGRMYKFRIKEGYTKAAVKNAVTVKGVLVNVGKHHLIIERQRNGRKMYNEGFHFDDVVGAEVI